MDRTVTISIDGTRKQLRSLCLAYFGKGFQPSIAATGNTARVHVPIPDGPDFLGYCEEHGYTVNVTR